MRVPNATAVTGGLAAALVLAACSGNDGSVTTPTEAASAPLSSSPTRVPFCVAGYWRSDPLPTGTRMGLTNAEVSGGADIDVSISRTGAATVGFTRMRPVRFTTAVGSVTIRGWFTYAGRAAGTITAAPAATVDDPSATFGDWRPLGEPDWDDTRLTVELTGPAAERLLGAAELDRYTGDEAEKTGHVVDVDPFFDSGRYACSGDTLTVTPAGNGDLPLVLQRG